MTSNLRKTLNPTATQPQLTTGEQVVYSQQILGLSEGERPLFNTICTCSVTYKGIYFSRIACQTSNIQCSCTQPLEGVRLLFEDVRQHSPQSVTQNRSVVQILLVEQPKEVKMNDYLIKQQVPEIWLYCTNMRQAKELCLHIQREIQSEKFVKSSDQFVKQQQTLMSIQN